MKDVGRLLYFEQNAVPLCMYSKVGNNQREVNVQFGFLWNLNMSDINHNVSIEEFQYDVKMFSVDEYFLRKCLSSANV